MNRIPEKLQNMGCKVKKKQCFTDYISYLYTQYFIIFSGMFASAPSFGMSLRQTSGFIPYIAISKKRANCPATPKICFIPSFFAKKKHLKKLLFKNSTFVH
jgi:hypothetical protein